jgi:RHS repeat-associated protein
MMGGLTPAVVAAAVPPPPPPPSDDQPVPAVPGDGEVPQDIPNPEEKSYTPPETVWPVAGRGELAVGDRLTESSKGSTVFVSRPEKAADPDAVPASVAVEVLDKKQVEQIGAEALAFRIERTDDKGSEGLLSVEVNYAGYARAFGGDFSSRLTLRTAPECVLTSPDKEDCAPSAATLPLENNLEGQRLSASLDADPDSTVPAERQKAASRLPDAEASTLAGGGGTVYLLSGASGGQTGTYEATPLSASGKWQAGGSSGNFSWPYPLTTPDPAAGPKPDLSVNYSSQSVDGFTASENAQPGWTGLGWDLGGLGFIEREYLNCPGDIGNWSINDLCWGGSNFTLTLNGHSSELIYDNNAPVTGLWRLKDDPLWRIQALSGAANGDNDGEYFVVTTPDGVQYYFGIGQEVGSGTATNSAWTVPVYGNQVGEPCYNATLNNSWCQQAWRWNLDRVIDLDTNIQTLFYDKDINYYGRQGNSSQVYTEPYVRSGNIDRIEYGQRGGTNLGPDQVRFFTAARCTETSASPPQACPAMNTTNANSYPDVPIDLICPPPTLSTSCTNHSPSFFTDQRLDHIITYTFDGTVTGTGNYRTVDGYTFTYKYPDSLETGVSPKLWLDGITHTGNPDSLDPGAPQYTSPGPIVLPTVGINGTFFVNRPDATATNNIPYTKYKRVVQIVNEVGGQLDISYGQPGHLCTQFSGWDTNDQYCFAVYAKLSSGPPGPVPQNKYVVTSVSQSGTGDSPTQTYTYHYLDSPAWHYDDAVVAPTTGQLWSDWRGHSNVLVNYGGSHTSYLYFRGMDGDKLTNGSTKVSTVVDGMGDSRTDSNFLAGYLREERTLDSGLNTITGTIHNHTNEVTATWSTENRFARVILENETDYRTAATGPAITTKTTTTFDPEHYPFEVRQSGDPDPAATNDDRCTTYTYARNSSLHLMSLPQEVTVDGNCTAPFNKRTMTLYDGATAPGSAPTEGHATTTRQYLVCPGCTDVTSDSTGDYYKTTQTFDTRGRPLVTTDPRLNPTTVGYLMDDNLPIGRTVTNAQGHLITTNLDRRRSQPTSVTDDTDTANPVTKSISSYDALGRLKTVLMADDPSNEPTHRYTYTVSQNVTSKVKSEKKLTMTSPATYTSSWTFYDGWGRVRETQLPAPSPAAGAVVTATKYDARSNVLYETQPFWTGSGFTAGSGLHNGNTGNIPHVIKTLYDEISRPTTSDNLEMGTSQWSSTMSYDGLTQLTVGPAVTIGGATVHRQSQKVNDRYGQLEQTVELNTDGSPYATTTYGYNPVGSLVHITDQALHPTTYGYDMLGRRISSTDPDAGLWSYEYDGNSNQIMVHDAKSSANTTWMKYNSLDQPIERRVDNSSGALLATWSYYASTSSWRGLLKDAISFDGTDQYRKTVTQYDLRSRPTETQVLPATSAGFSTVPFVTTTGYDAADNVVSKTFAGAGGMGAETVSAPRDAQGRPDTLSGSSSDPAIGSTSFVTATDFQADGLLQARSLSSGPTTYRRSYTYEPVGTSSPTAGRLYRMKSEVIGAGANVFQNDVFTYDADSNITDVTDEVNSNQKQCFSYDHLNRLVKAFTSDTCTLANGSFGPSPYYLEFKYNEIGNMVESTNVLGPTAYGYTSSKPHAATSFGANIYHYDENGNMDSRTVAGQSWTHAWDRNRRLSSMTKTPGGDTTRFIYDAEGQRILRKAPDGSGGTRTTLYLDGQEVHRDQSGIKTTERYYSMDGVEVAVRNSSGVKYLFGDRQGSSSYSIAMGSSTFSQQRYLPYGGPRGGTTSGFPTEHDYLGEVKDDSTGLIATPNRYYDPLLRRFISADPLVGREAPQALNGYQYADNNPTTKADPSGLSAISCPEGSCANSASTLRKAQRTLPPPCWCTPPGQGPFTIGRPDPSSASQLAKKANGVAEAADILSAGSQLCKGGTCVALSKVSKDFGTAADVVSFVGECHDGIDRNCVALALNWGIDYAVTAALGEFSVVYFYGKDILVPVLGQALAGLQEETVSPGQPQYSSASFHRYSDRYVHNVYPNGSSDSPYMCTSGLPAGFGVC